MLNGEPNQCAVQVTAAAAVRWRPERIRDSARTTGVVDVRSPSGRPDLDEELANARQLEEYELAYWRALLSLPAVLPKVRAVLAGVVPETVSALDAASLTLRSLPWDRAVHGVLERAAVVLRAADQERAALKRTHDTVRRWSIDPSDECFRSVAGGELDRYCRTVHEAWLAQHRCKNRLVAANLRLVVGLARKYRVGHLSVDDLVQEGNLGLIKAVERFDHRLGYRFSTYACWWIRHAIRRAVADKARIVRLPVHMIQTRSVLNRTKQALMAQAGEEPSLEKLARTMGIPESRVALAGTAPETELSLESAVHGIGGACFKDQLEDPAGADVVDQISVAGWLARLPEWLDILTPMEGQILRWRFGLEASEEMTLREIGERYGYSRERVRQLEERALDKIRRRIEERHGIVPIPDEC